MDESVISIPARFILPVELQNEYNTYLFHALPMCVLKTDDKYDAWEFCHNVNIRMAHPELVLFDYQDNILLGFGDNLLTYDFLPRGFLYGDICAKLEERIAQRQQYAYLMLDEYYLSSKKKYHTKLHRIHDSLIYGFDCDKQEFYAITDGAETGVIQKAIYTYADINAAYSALANDMNPMEYSAIFFKPNPEYKPSFSLGEYMDRLTRYANGMPPREYIYTKSAMTTLWPISFGINVYDCLIEQLLEKDDFNFSDFRNVHFLYEHKAILIKGLRYLIGQNLIPADFEKAIQEYEDSKRQITKIRYQFLKFREMKSMKPSADKSDKMENSKNRICQSLADYRDQERENIIMVLEHLKLISSFAHFPPNGDCMAFSENYRKNLVKYAKIQKIDIFENDDNIYGYAHHVQFVLQWDKTVQIGKVHFRCNGLMYVSTNNTDRRIPVNTLSNTDWQHRTVGFDQTTDSILFDVFSQMPVCFEDLNLMIPEGSLISGKSATASSCWLGDDGKPREDCLPLHALTESNKFWNARRNFSKPEWIEVDFGEEILINCIVVQERRDIARIHHYYLEVFDRQGKAFRVAKHLGSMGGRAIVHKFADVKAHKLRLTILRTKTDQNGLSEPGICRLEAYYSDDT